MKFAFILGFFVNMGLIKASVYAQTTDTQPSKPCREIAQLCEKAGFEKGEWKKGNGLWRDCVNPLLQGTTVVPGATKPLPQVDAQLVSACKEKHPQFGKGKIGSEIHKRNRNK